jgi:ferredoxin--NADP+ reductase
MADWIAGRVIDKQQWNDTHYSVRIDAAVEAFRAGQFARFGLDLGEERVGRPYSFVNAPAERPLEIFFNVVPDGPLSSRLAALHAGDDLWVTPKPNGNLTLDSVPDDARHLWLLATGTAIGPFLSILKTAEPWERFDRVVLAYGVRHVADLAYQDLIEQLQQAHPEQLTYVPLVTREAMPDAIKARIPAALQEGVLERRAGVCLDGAHVHAMLCGNAGMIADASSVLEARGLKRNLRREPGQFSTEKYH